jgi:hypothetical protein
MALILVIIGLVLMLATVYNVLGLILLVVGLILLFVPGVPYGYGYWHDRRGPR